MIYEHGELICPKCNNSGMGKYTNWSSRLVFKEEKKIKQYIFYYIEKSRKDCYMCHKCKKCLEYDLPCLCGLICDLFFILLYIILFFWLVDIICYFCCLEDLYYYLDNKSEVDIPIYASKYEDVWTKENIPNKGLTKGYWTNKKNKFKKLFICSKCFYNPDSFFPFMKKDKEDKKDKKDKEDKKDKKDETDKMDKMELLKVSDTVTTNAIAINIISNEGTLPIVCYPSDLFKNILNNRVFKEFPKYNLSNSIFLANGQPVDPNISISKNNIKDGDNILIQLLTNDDDDEIDYEEGNFYKAYQD